MQARQNLIQAFENSVDWSNEIITMTIDRLKEIEEKGCDISEYEAKLARLNKRVVILATQLDRELKKIRAPYSI